MKWHEQINLEDKIIACLPYLLPMTAAVVYGGFIIEQIPSLGIFLSVLLPLLPLVSGIPGLVIFFALYGLVVRNTSIKHFIRFNTMQALLLDIGLSILSLTSSLLGFMVNPLLQLIGNSGGLLLSTISSTIFLGIFSISIYSWVFNLQGIYPKVPFISDAADYYTRY